MSAKRLAVLAFIVFNLLEPFRTAKQEDYLNTAHLADVLTALKNGYFASSNWVDLGLKLGLTYPTLKDIGVNHVKDVSGCLRECLVKWLERADDVDKKGGPTWTALAKALQKIDQKQAADYILKKSLPSLPSSDDGEPYSGVTEDSFYSPPTSQAYHPINITSGRPKLQERIWMYGEAGEDVVNLCISKLQESGIFPDDKGFMRRIAHVMSRFGVNPPFQLLKSSGIWQVSMHAFIDTFNTQAHVQLKLKYEQILHHFNIDWNTVDRRLLELPMYSAIAARLYLSNFAESIPPVHDVERQADYWWKIYMKNHESMAGLKRADFLETVRTLAK